MKIKTSLSIIILMCIGMHSQTKAQNNSGLTELDKDKIQLINDLCVVKTMYAFRMDGQTTTTQAIIYMGAFIDCLDNSKYLMDNKLKLKVSPDIIKQFDDIYKGYSKLEEMSKDIGSNNTKTMNISLYKKLVDMQIDEFIKSLMCK